MCIRDSVNADATASTRPVDIILCLDASRSMNRVSSSKTLPPGATTIHQPPVPESRWFEVVQTVSQFLQAMRDTNPNARVGLVTFGGGLERPRTPKELEVISDLDADYARFEQELAVVISNDVGEINTTLQSYVTDFPALGLGTSLYDGIIKSLDAFDNDQASRHIVMLSDGNQIGVTSRPSPSTAAQAAAAENVTIHAISFGGNFGEMQTVANEANGSYFTALSEEQLRDAFTALLGRFKVQLVD